MITLAQVMGQPFPDKPNIKCNLAGLAWLLRTLEDETTKAGDGCLFGDWKCPHLNSGRHLCGGLPDQRYKKYSPWYSVLSSHPPAEVGRKYRIELAYFRCIRGALGREQIEYEIGAVEVEIARVNKDGLTIMDTSDPLLLGCERRMGEQEELNKAKAKTPMDFAPSGATRPEDMTIGDEQLSLFIKALI